MLPLSELLQDMYDTDSPDLILTAGSAPKRRTSGVFVQVPGTDVLTPADTEAYLPQILSEKQIASFKEELELDTAFSIDGLSRFRLNVYYQRGSIGLAIRMIPFDIPAIDNLGLPPLVKDFANRPNGLVLVTGPTGSGKSTTLAALVGEINATRPCHILTIEDPVEFVHRDRRASVTQREIGTDTESFERALRSGLRQDPDVIVIGEIRDLATMRIAAQAAETGHLVLASVHAGSALETVHRMVSLFEVSEQDMARAALAESLVGVVSQRLVTAETTRKRTLVTEVMVRTPRISEAISQPDRSDPLEEIIGEGEYYGMHTLLQDAVRLVLAGDLSVQDASRVVANPAELDVALHRNGYRSTSGVTYV